jgi:hypothetical protein
MFCFTSLMTQQAVTSIVAAERIFNGLDGPGCESLQRRGIFCFPGPSVLALGPSQPPIQWVLALFSGRKPART